MESSQGIGDAANGGIQGGMVEAPPGQGVFHVNDRKGRVAARGEELAGREILSRVGLNADRYELFGVDGGKVGPEVPPDSKVFVKPGDHFRATLRGTDYSMRLNGEG